LVAGAPLGGAASNVITGTDRTTPRINDVLHKNSAFPFVSVTSVLELFVSR
jgi:hypothetical protein